MLRRDAPWVPPGLGRSRRAISATSPVTTADQGIIIEATVGTYDVTTGSAASTFGAGFSFGLYNYGTGVVSFNPNGTETIRTPSGTATTVALSQGQGAFFQTDGTNWYVISSVGLTGGSSSVTTDNAVARFDGAAGALQNSGVIIDDSNNVTGVVALTIGGALAGVTTIANSGIQTNSNATDATTISNGSSTHAGGVSVTKALWVGGLINIGGVATFADATAATTTTNGSVRLAGGLSVVGAIVNGGLISSGGGFRSTAGAGAQFDSDASGCNFQTLTNFPLFFSPNGVTKFQVNSSRVMVTSGVPFRVGSTYVAGAQVNTGYIVIEDAAGTQYKLNCNV